MGVVATSRYLQNGSSSLGIGNLASFFSGSIKGWLPELPILPPQAIAEGSPAQVFGHALAVVDRPIFCCRAFGHCEGCSEG